MYQHLPFIFFEEIIFSNRKFTTQHFTISSDIDAMEENCRSLTQEQAVQIGLEMFGLLAARCVLLFKEHIASQDLGVNFVQGCINFRVQLIKFHPPQIYDGLMLK